MRAGAASGSAIGRETAQKTAQRLGHLARAIERREMSTRQHDQCGPQELCQWSGDGINRQKVVTLSPQY
jgi:hypothetical protein